VSAGEKRVICQHGGEYGMFDYNMMANEMELKSSIFISWGWQDPNQTACHIVPLPSPLHSKVAGRHQRNGNSIIVVGQPIRVHLNRLHWWTQGATQMRYCRVTIKFLTALTDSVRKDVIFRPYARTHSEIDIRDMVNKNFPDMLMLEDGLNEAIMSSRLVVLATQSTTLNFTLAVNAPTVVYLSPEDVQPNKVAQPYFEGLKKCGVIHETTDAAAAHINKISDNIDGWWESVEVQEARKIWVEQYARTNRFWWWYWAKALAKLKNVG
jgi:putative transferase (TIGR04331 family)